MYEPVRLGCDWGRDGCDAVRLRGRSSELCTLGLIDPGESTILLCRSFTICSPLVDRGLGARLQK